MRIAGIDIGTNTALLLIAEIGEDGIPHPLEQALRFPRLGRNVDSSRIIAPAGFDVLTGVMLEYSAIISRHRVDAIAAWATSAMRDASNSADLIAHIQNQTGIRIEIVSGETEAVWTYRGALSGLPELRGTQAVLDIGGGSTELSYAASSGELRRYSMQLGAVRLTERAFSSLPPSPESIRKAKEIIGEALSTFSIPDGLKFKLVGVAGSVTTLACLEQGLLHFDSEKVNGYQLTMDAIEQWFEKLSVLSPEQIEALSTSTHGRADILTAGVLILLETMKRYRLESITVSDRGLRFGVVMNEWERRAQKPHRKE